MAGIYLHIPFCKQACHYCNFHFSTSLKYKDQLLEALHAEISLSHDYLQNQNVQTIYFGGGTPSMLNAPEINNLLSTISKYHTISEDVEITLETNPDDLTHVYLKGLRETQVNRLSVGIQSFNDTDLKFMNRAHNASEAENAIRLARDLGFDNLTIDLIYGSPTTSDAIWQENLRKTLDFEIPHISCYALTVEPKTALDHFIRSGKSPQLNEEKAARHFYYLTDTLTEKGYEHYEISNFSLPGHYSRHNTAYWKGVPYLGIGPSAHSFNGRSRRWNVANNAKYIRAVNNRLIPFETEELTPAERYNEYVMTSLRTMWGCSSEKLKEFGAEYLDFFIKSACAKQENGLMALEDDHYKLTREGKFLADGIIRDLFYV